MKGLLAVLSIVLLLYSCSGTGRMPTKIDKSEIDFAIAPYIACNDSDYFLVYQVALDGRAFKPRINIDAKSVAGKYYFYVSGKTSLPEYDHLVKRPLTIPAADRSLFTAGAVYWLKAGRNEKKTQVKEE